MNTDPQNSQRTSLPVDAQVAADSAAATGEFMKLFSQHQRTVYLYLRGMLPTSGDVDDVFQETCMVLWREFDKFEIGTNFGAWACTIAFNRVRAWRTKRSRDSLVFSDAFLAAVSQEMIDHGDHYIARADALQNCVAKLPPHHRELIDSRYGAEKSIVWIASKSNRSEDAVYRMLSRIRASLHDCVTHSLRTGEVS